MRAIALLALVSLAACGGGSDNSSSDMPAAKRGDLGQRAAGESGDLSPGDLLALLGTSDLGKALLQLAYTPKCTITVYHLTYQTADPGQHRSGVGCSHGAGRQLGLHRRAADRAVCTWHDHGPKLRHNLEASDSAEGVVLAAVFAAEGYVVVAPNYLGYDTSTLGYHPYLVAAQQSTEMIDALTAARTALPTADAPNSTDGGKLFVTGYSEGGYVAMATHSAMQSGGMTVTASAPMSGPYALVAFGDAIFEGEVSDSATVNVALLVPAYQNVYGDIYQIPGDVFASKYAASIPTLLPSSTPLSTLRSEGKFPSRSSAVLRRHRAMRSIPRQPRPPRAAIRRGLRPGLSR